MKIRDIQYEKASRKDFAKVGDFIEMPNLIKVQKDSYEWFIKEGLGEVLKDISPIEDYSGNLVLEFFDYYMEDKTKYSIEEAKERDATYSTRLHVKVRLINRETGEIKEQEIYLGDFPLMTDSGTFIINGAERVIVSQIVRSPSAYFSKKIDKTGREIFASTLNPKRGSWLEIEQKELEELNKWYFRPAYSRQLSKVNGIKRMIFYTESFIQTEIRKRHADRLLEVLHKRFPKYHSGYEEIMRMRYSNGR